MTSTGIENGKNHTIYKDGTRFAIGRSTIGLSEAEAFQILKKAAQGNESHFKIVAESVIFDSATNEADYKKLVEFRSAERSNAIHAGIRASDRDIG